MANANEILLRKAYDAQAEGDIDGYIQLLADDFVRACVTGKLPPVERRGPTPLPGDRRALRRDVPNEDPRRSRQ